MMTKLLPNERLDDLQIRGYEIIQSPGRFCFGMDAVLLSAFANVKKHEKALDLGTGTGILPILLEAKYPGLHYTGLEIQEESADMAKRSVSHNGLEERIDARERLRPRAGRTAAVFRCVRAASLPSAGHRASPASTPCSVCFHPSPACRAWSAMSTKCARQPPPSAQAESAAATARPAVDCPAAPVRVQGYSSADSLPARATVRGMACWSVRVKPMSRPSPAKARVLAMATGRARETAKPMA